MGDKLIRILEREWDESWNRTFCCWLRLCHIGGVYGYFTNKIRILFPPTWRKNWFSSNDETKIRFFAQNCDKSFCIRNCLLYQSHQGPTIEIRTRCYQNTKEVFYFWRFYFVSFGRTLEYQYIYWLEKSQE